MCLETKILKYDESNDFDLNNYVFFIYYTVIIIISSFTNNNNN
jgi:hypothetical protein